MSCTIKVNNQPDLELQDTQAVKDYEILSSRLGISEANTIMRFNNGYSLDRQPNGDISKLYMDIRLVSSSRENALLTKSMIYTRPVINEPSIEELTGIDINALPELTINDAKAELKQRAMQYAMDLGATNKDYLKSSVLGANTAKEAEKIAKQINKASDYDIAVANKSAIVFKVKAEDAINYKNKKLAIEFKKAEAEALRHTIQQDIESKANELFQDNPTYDYDLSDYPLKPELGTTNLMNFKKFHEIDLDKLKKELSNTRSERKTAKTKQDIHRLQTRIARLVVDVNRKEKYIKTLKTNLSVEQNFAEMATKDLDRASELIANGNDKDLLEAGDIIGWYSALGEFSAKSDHPFFSDNTTADVANEFKEEMKSIADRAKKLSTNLDNIIKQRFYKKLKENPNFEGLGVNMTIEKLFNNYADDIDALSSLLLNPYFEFDSLRGNKNTLSAHLLKQLMFEEFAKKEAVKKSEVVAMADRIDSIIKSMKNKVKNFTIFIAKDKDGNPTENLINWYSAEWDNFLSSTVGKWNNLIRDAQSKGISTELFKSKKYKAITEKADFLRPSLFPEIRAAFPGLVSPNITDDLAKMHKQNYIDKYGIHEYNRLVQQQILAIEEFEFQFNKELNNELTVHGGQSSFYMLPETVKKRLVYKYVENNPFLASLADENGKVTYNYKGVEITTYVSLNHNIIEPKSENTEFKNNDFDKIKNDPELYELWKAMSDSLEYINEVLIKSGQKKVTFNSLSAMQKQTFKDQLKKTFKTDYNTTFFQRLKKLHQQQVDIFKKKIRISIKENVKTAKSDEISSRGIKALSTVVKDRYANVMKTANRFIGGKLNDDELLNLNESKYEGLKNFLKQSLPTATYNKLLAKPFKYSSLKKILLTNVRQEVFDRQSLDLVTAIKHNLAVASRMDAAMEVLPALNIIKKLHDDIKTEEGKERVNDNAQLKAWYNRVVRGFYGNKGIPINRSQGWNFMLTKEEKQRRRELLALFDLAKNDKERALIESELETLGDPINFAAVIGGVQSWAIIQALAYNIKSGVFNRFAGNFQNAYFDRLGTYWTPGNNEKSHAFFKNKTIKNFYKLGEIAGTAEKNGWAEKANQISIAETFLGRTSIHTDVRNEQQKATDKLGKETLGTKLGWGYLSVTAVELRNQGSTIFSVAQDFSITDRNGNTVPIFNENGFVMYDNVDYTGTKVGEKNPHGAISKGGILRLKDEFRYNADGTENTKNIDNWEKMTGEEYQQFYVNAVVATIAVHGDYSSLGGMRLKQNLAGNLLSTFMTFMPQLLHGRYGAGVSLASGKKRDKGAYKSLKAGAFGVLVTGAAVGTLGPYALAVGGIAFVAKRLLGQTIKHDIPMTLELLETAKAIIIASTNLPLNLVTGKQDVIKHKGVTKLKMSAEDLSAFRAMMFEISFQVNSIIATVIAIAALHCDDDTPECAKQTRIKNIVANNGVRLMNDIMLPASPLDIASSIQRGAYLRKVTDLWNFVTALYDYLKGQDVILSGSKVGESRLENATKKLVSPSIVRFVMDDTEGEKIYSTATNTKTIPEKVEEEFFTSKDKLFTKQLKGKRAKYKAELRKKYKKRYKHLSGKSYIKAHDKYEKIIKKEVDKKYPTYNKLVKDLKKRHPGNWKKYIEKKVKRILDRD